MWQLIPLHLFLVLPPITSWATTAQGTLTLAILPDRKDIYVPDIPNIGKYEIGGVAKYSTPYMDAIINQAVNIVLTGGIAPYLIQRYIAGNKHSGIAPNKVHLPVLLSSL